MKKFALCGALCIVMAAAVSADLSVRGSIIAFWDAFQYVEPGKDDRETLRLTGLGRSGGNSIEALLDFSGQLENRNAGFRAQLSYQGGTTLAAHENILVWVRPFDWMRIDVGKMKVDDMYKLPLWFFPTLDTFMLRAGRDKDIFSNYEANNSLLLRLTPVKNLFIGAFLYNQAILDQGENAVSTPFIGDEDAEDAFKRIQATVAYTIPDIGFARVQYYGVNPDINTDTHLITAPRFEAAFALTAVPNLTVDLGGKYFLLLEDPLVPARRNIYTGSGRIPIPALPDNTAGEDAKTGTVERAGTFQAPQQVSLGIRYEMKNIGPGTLTLQGRADTKFWGYYQEPGKNITRIGPEVKASLWPSYRIDSYTFQVETTVVYAGDWTKYGKTVYQGGFGYSFGGFVQKNFGSGCSLLVGIAYSAGEGIVLPKNGTGAGGTAVTPHEELAGLSSATDAGKLPAIFSIPIKFSVFF
jgi:hypothetical protein